MATYNIGNRKHLTLADRAAIEHGIQIGENFSQIARKLNKDFSTISKYAIRDGVFRLLLLSLVVKGVTAFVSQGLPGKPLFPVPIVPLEFAAKLLKMVGRCSTI